MKHAANFFARALAHATARRIAYVIVAAVLAWCGLGKAHAGSHSVDQGTAYTACMKEMVNWKASEPSYTAWACEHSVDATAGIYTLRYTHPNGQRRDADNFSYDVGQTCTQRTPTDAGFYNPQAISNKCQRGCEYTLNVSQATTKLRVDIDNGNQLFQNRGSYTPTGGVCPPEAPRPEPPKDNFCFFTEGGHKICLDSKGRQCVTSAKGGRTFCGKPNEALNATNPDRTENVNITAPAPTPGTPPPAGPQPRPGENWQPGGTSSITNITNNTTTNTNTSNNAGTPNTTPGSGNPNDGSDNPGKPGPGEEDDDDEGDKPGDAGEGVGELYDGEPLTPSEALDTYMNAAKTTQLGEQLYQFFGNCTFGGACPVWTYDGGEWMGVQTFDALCTGMVSDLLAYGAYVVLAMAAFAAFRIAVY
ncbi:MULTISPECIES: hypothetical protein [unclassified Lysobacter]|uniref:hypothetical protein n=1 Tax=unclassified Lysobacter TaxID=2635362 RepID=UPI0006F1E15C|nr:MULTISPECIES: hypothetical protein [unclassified Lysobacter]KRC33938.1 hypothetical protein ASE10_13460 [Lysobacter sp. Root76]KRD69272.1 hypothetical protein ASE45_08900 [Lysobacter sp. Root96]